MRFVEGERSDFNDLGSLTAQIEASLRWYTEQFPVVVNDRKIEMENIGDIAAAAVLFCLDTKILLHNDSATLEALSSSVDNDNWSNIDDILRSLVPNFANYFGAYLRWVFVKTEEKYWEPGSRPPVGRYVPGARNRRPGMGSGPRRSGPSSGGRSGGNDRRPPRDGDRGPRRDSYQGGGNRDGGPREGGNHRDGNRDRSRGPRDRDRSGGAGGSHAEQEAAAMQAVDTAITRLKSENELSEVRLDPSNSFFRRLQHKKAVEQGFYSFSTGEGNTRSVVVTRDKPAHEEGV